MISVTELLFCATFFDPSFQTAWDPELWGAGIERLAPRLRIRPAAKSKIRENETNLSHGEIGDFASPS
jgi:hypothetical protein